MVHGATSGRFWIPGHSRRSASCKVQMKIGERRPELAPVPRVPFRPVRPLFDTEPSLSFLHEYKPPSSALQMKLRKKPAPKKGKVVGTPQHPGSPNETPGKKIYDTPTLVGQNTGEEPSIAQATGVRKTNLTRRERRITKPCPSQMFRQSTPLLGSKRSILKDIIKLN